LSLRGGEFQVKPFKAPPQRTIESRWELLLLDAARTKDEETGMMKKTALPAATPAPAAENNEHAALGDDIVVVATYDGKWITEPDPKK
jgi:hypothetical protein